MKGTPQLSALVVCHVQVVDSSQRELPASRRDTEKFSAVGAPQHPARCSPARVGHNVFGRVLLVGSGLMVPEEEVFVTLETVLTFRIVWRVKDKVSREDVIRDRARFRDVGFARDLVVVASNQ